VHESSGSRDGIFRSVAGYTLYDYKANQISEGPHVLREGQNIYTS